MSSLRISCAPPPVAEYYAVAHHDDNAFLLSLDEPDYALLRPGLRKTSLRQGTVLFESGGNIDTIYFPLSGVVSFVVTLSDGQTVEAGMTGREGVVGAPAALDGAFALNTAIVQVACEAKIIDAEAFRSVLPESPRLRAKLYQRDQALLLQAQQSGACNIRHEIEARLCRWLLRSSDLVGSKVLPLTQEFIAQMLGVTRPSVSLTAHRLQAGGLIRYRRGIVEILDLDGLRESACECYQAIKDQEARLFGHQTN
jgi:CRP-like cAMP-binding protein